MSLSARKFTHISAAEYLATENDGSWRHEFVSGVVFAMPASRDWQELFRRRTDWQLEFYQRDNTVTFESVGLKIKVSLLYRDIDFEDPTHSAAARRTTQGEVP